MKLLGDELISDDVVAVTELVKNSHDADASTVTIAFRGVTGDGGEIVVKDDGCGMDKSTLLNRWMEPANSWKAGKERRTRRGRRVLGEKGVGRFATDKLAAQLELISRKSRKSPEIMATFDWDRFADDEKMLSEIKCHWMMRPAIELPGQGTVLRMSGLRSRWTERMFRRLSTRLTRLISPFDELDDFRIVIESDEFPHYSGELRADFLNRAPHHIDASFDGNHTIQANLNGSRSTEHLWNGAGELSCGPVRLKIYAFDLETEAIARIGPRMEVRAWLKEWTGASIYRDGFRVWPYGEPHDDWLRLDQRRVNNPVVRLSNNQVVGFIRISSDDNPDLRDQTNREGLIHNKAFDDLRRLVYFVLQILEAERQKLRHPTSRVSLNSSRSDDPRDSLPSLLEKLVKETTPDNSEELKRIVRDAEEAYAREASDVQKFIQGYSGLAALGQAAIGVESNVRPLVDEIRSGFAALKSEVNGRGSRRLTSQIRALETNLDAIESRLAIIAAMETGGTHRRRRAIDVPTELLKAKQLLAPVLDQRGIDIRIEAPRKGVLRVEMRPEELQRILHILAMNSVDWLHRVKEPRIKVQAKSKNDRCEIIFSDNGPGISHDLVAQVFEPLFSTKEGGRGMGLTIARNVLGLYGGSIDVLNDARRRGANIRVSLPKKRSRSTVHGY
jgi:signal transduction histidine kinase